MKKLLVLMMTICMAFSLAACGGSSDQTTTAAEQTDAQTTAAEVTDSDFEEQVFECDTVMITVTGMSLITEGQNAGYIALDMTVENLTNIDLLLPAFTELTADMIANIPDYPMGVKSGDNLVLAADGTGEFSHLWEIQDDSGEVIDYLSMELTVSKELMDQSQDAGITYKSAVAGVDEPATYEDTVIVEDDWVRITFADISSAPSSEGGSVLEGTLNVENISGKGLLIASEGRMSDGMGGVFKETDEEDFPASAVSVRPQPNAAFENDHYVLNTKEYTVLVFDPDDIYYSDKDEYGTYVFRRGRAYHITVSVEDGVLETSYTMEETSEFAYMAP